MEWRLSSENLKKARNQQQPKRMRSPGIREPKQRVGEFLTGRFFKDAVFSYELALE
jgi:hypothetical protein